MRLIKQTIETRTDSENEAKELIETYRKEAGEKGYTIGSAGYTYKTRKSKGKIIDEAYVVKVIQVFGGLWEELE
ncbi:MAG: hypothetical protein ACOYIG_11860 [Acetivibrionales bacterium]|jgi:hypothetical protein